MAKVIQKNRIIKIGQEPIVILPLRSWTELEEKIEDLEDAVRFNKAFNESRGEKMISLKGLGKKYNL